MVYTVIIAEQTLITVSDNEYIIIITIEQYTQILDHDNLGHSSSSATDSLPNSFHLPAFSPDERKVLICFLRIAKDETSSKCLIKILQEAIVLGKKLFMYLFDLQIILRKVLPVFPLNNVQQLGRSLFFR